jgi:hypothetical protein
LPHVGFAESTTLNRGHFPISGAMDTTRRWSKSAQPRQQNVLVVDAEFNFDPNALFHAGIVVPRSDEETS